MHVKTEVVESPTEHIVKTQRELRTEKVLKRLDTLCDAVVALECELFDVAEVGTLNGLRHNTARMAEPLLQSISCTIASLVALLNDDITSGRPPFSSAYGVAYDLSCGALTDYYYPQFADAAQFAGK